MSLVDIKLKNVEDVTQQLKQNHSEENTEFNKNYIVTFAKARYFHTQVQCIL